MSHLSPIEVRVLGVLMEKAVTTPDQYPLTLNSLALGCNQKTSRDPVLDLGEDEVEAALDELRDRRLVLRVDMAGSRVAKFRQRVDDEWELTTAENALLCVLLLRGPQTVGQLRQRTERLFGFRDLNHVRETLDGMSARAIEPTVLVELLPVRPGSKEQRFAQTLCPLVEGDSAAAEDRSVGLPPSSRETEMTTLRAEVEALQAELGALRSEFEAFKAQF